MPNTAAFAPGDTQQEPLNSRPASQTRQHRRTHRPKRWTSAVPRIFFIVECDRSLSAVLVADRLDRSVDGAMDAARPVVDRHAPGELRRKGALDHARAETGAGRRDNNRPAALMPVPG